MTGKQFAKIISRLYGPEKITEKAAAALECSKRTIERHQARGNKKVPKFLARVLADIADKAAAS